MYSKRKKNMKKNLIIDEKLKKVLEIYEDKTKNDGELHLNVSIRKEYADAVEKTAELLDILNG